MLDIKNKMENVFVILNSIQNPEFIDIDSGSSPE
jgi:hypothetical protein